MKKLILLAALTFACLSSDAQRYVWDFGGRIGAANSMGEIGGDEKAARAFIWDLRFPQSRFSGGLFARYKFTDLISVNASLNYYGLEGSDAISSNPGRKGRNLSFKNDVFDFTGRGEIYVYNVNDLGNKGYYRMDFRTFLFGGVSAFYHNPKAKSPIYNDNEWTALRPLKTEGQTKEYSKIVVGIPLGLGFHFTYRRQHRFGLELGTTLTFTDYMDDVSSIYPDYAAVDPLVYDAFTNRSDELEASELPGGGLSNYLPGSKRGSSKQNDAFVYSMATYSYVLRGGQNTFYRQHFGWIKPRRGGKRKVRAKF